MALPIQVERSGHAGEQAGSAHLHREQPASVPADKALKDPVCGMTVDEATAIHAERDGKTFYFCGDHCRQKFLSTPAGSTPERKSGGCCG